MITATEIATNIYGLAGVSIGTFGGIAIAYLSNKSKRERSENKEIAKLKNDLEELSAKFDSLKLGFTLVFDEMDRKGELPEQLKAFKKMFDL